MSNPYLGEIRMFAGNFAPVNWAFCDGSLLSIANNSALFALIGTTYGGDGQSTFALPDLRSRCPVHQGNGFVIGQSGGVEAVTLALNQLPVHSHAALASSTGGNVNPDNAPAGNYWSGWTGGAYSTQTPNTPMNSAALSSAGGSQAHDNMVPFLTVNFIIALAGIFPSQT